jgi:DNA-binding transcriptional LysR family regulator
VEPRRLEHFLAVAEEGGFTRAAARLHMAQSGVSASIRSLERDLGVDLFSRTTQHVALTEAGRALIPEARRVLGAVRQARQTVAEARTGTRGTLALGIPGSLTPRPVLAALSSFRADHPHVDVRITAPGPGGPDLLATLLRDGALDLAVLATTTAVPGLRLYAARAEQVALACASGDPLAGRDGVSLVETVGLDLVDFPVGWGVRTAVDQAFAAAGVSRRPPRVEVCDLATVVDLVRHRLGVAFVPRSLAEQTPGLRLVPVEPHPPRYQVAVAAADDRPLSLTAAAFLDRFVRPRRAA